jgi:hypothetical protein
MKAGLYVLWAATLLAGCATPAYRAIEQECTPAALADYPINKVQVVQNRQRVIHVTTGMRSGSRPKRVGAQNGHRLMRCQFMRAALWQR